MHLQMSLFILTYATTLQIQYIVFMVTSVLQVMALVVAVRACSSSPSFVTALEHELSHLERVHVTHDEYLNATRNAYSHTQCVQTAVEDHTPLSERTLCPWEYVHNVDMDRFPPILTTAKCKCEKCLNAQNYRCMPIFYAIDVLKKSCFGDSFRWIRKTELIAVACACTRPSVRHAQHKRSLRQRLFGRNRQHSRRTGSTNGDLDADPIMSNPGSEFVPEPL